MLTKKTNKILSTIVTIGMFFLQSSPYLAQAAYMPGDLSDDEQDEVTAALSGVEGKEGGPTVQLTFSSEGFFKPGTKVTATAVTGGFMQGPEELYYTWYIKKQGCDLTDKWWEDVTDDNTECDLDGDDKITPNDWKIRAAKKLIKSENGNKVITEKKADPPVEESADGWRKNFATKSDGKLYETNSANAPYCYARQPSSGKVYELTQTTASFEEIECPEGYVLSCLEDKEVSCNVLNPEFNEDDPNCYPIETPSCVNPKSISNDFPVCQVSSTTKTESPESMFSCSITAAQDGEDSDDYIAGRTTISCKDGGRALCAKDPDYPDNAVEDLFENNTLGLMGDTELVEVDNDNDGTSAVLGIIFTENRTAEEACSAVAVPNTNGGAKAPPPSYLDNTNTAFDENHQTCEQLSNYLINGETGDLNVRDEVVEGGRKVKNGKTVIEGNKELEVECESQKDPDGNLCKHLFPYYPPENDTLGEKDKLGDGELTEGELKFWGIPPIDPKESKLSSYPTDATLTGLGMDSYTWDFATGDKIGVVVEGDAQQLTEHESSSAYKRTWAFSQNTCPAMEDIEEEGNSDIGGSKSFYTEGSTNIYTMDFDLDKCIEDNLESPSDSDENRMKIVLDYSPKNPVNDPAGVYGDTVKIGTGVINVGSAENVFYKWNVEVCDQPDYPEEEDTCIDKTSELVGNGSFSNSDKRGFGKNELNILLNLPESIVTGAKGAFYLRVKVLADEASADRKVEGVAYIRVKQQSAKINAYSAIANDSAKLSLNKNAPLCANSNGLCGVTQNKIVGLEIGGSDNEFSDISWEVNGKEMSCDSDMSDECSDDGTVLFFPILGNIGESVNVVATAKGSGEDNTGDKIEIIKRFVIVEPQIAITSADDSAWPKLLGYYRTLESTKSCFVDSSTCEADYSSKVFETNSGNKVTFNAIVASSWSQSSSFSWTLDGQIMYEDSDKLSFTADKAVGGSYSVSLIADAAYGPDVIKQMNNVRYALQEHWGISPAFSAADDEKLSKTIQLNVVDISPTTLSSSGRGGIFASLITNLPEQLMFLLKIALTSFALIFFMSFLFAFMPESYLNKDEKI